jgi:hypothetical protein
LNDLEMRPRSREEREGRREDETQSKALSCILRVLLRVLRAFAVALNLTFVPSGAGFISVLSPPDFEEILW